VGVNEAVLYRFVEWIGEFTRGVSKGFSGSFKQLVSTLQQKSSFFVMKFACFGGCTKVTFIK